MAITFRRIVKGILLEAQSADPGDNLAGSAWYNSTDNSMKMYLDGAVRTAATLDQTQTLSNKTFSTNILLGSAGSLTLGSSTNDLATAYARLYTAADDQAITVRPTSTGAVGSALTLQGGVGTATGGGISITGGAGSGTSGAITISTPADTNTGSITISTGAAADSGRGIIDLDALTVRMSAQHAADPGGTPAEGDIYYNTTTKKLRIYDGTNYVDVSSDATGSAASLEPEAGFQAVFEDTFVDEDNVDAGLPNRTNAAYDSTRQLYQISCDKSLTATSSGVNVTLSGSPGFSIAAGDIIYDSTSGEFRIITGGTQAAPTVDAAFTTDLAGQSVTVSQAVYTNDIINTGDAGQKTRPRDFFSGDINTIFLEYDDSLSSNDDVADKVDEARIVASFSNEGLVTDTSSVPLGSEFSTLYTRPAAPNQILNYALSTNANQERLFGVFFANPANGSVTTTANLLGYKVSFFEDAATTVSANSVVSAYAMSDGSTTPINAALSTVNSVTRVTLDWYYDGRALSGQTEGHIDVYVDGKKIPRDQTAVGSGELSWTPGSISGATNVLDFSADLSISPVDIQIVLRQGIDVQAITVDNSDDTNYIINGGFDFWQRGTNLTQNGTKYYMDRFKGFRGNAIGNLTMTRANIPVSESVVPYYARVQRPSGDTNPGGLGGSGSIYFGTVLESNESRRLAGKTCTFSFYMRKTTGSTSTQMSVIVETGTGTDESGFGVAPFTGNATLIGITEDISGNPNSFVKYEYTFTVPTSANQIQLYLNFNTVGTAPADDIIDLKEFMLNVGETSLPFTRAGKTIQGELALCQRYYEKGYELDITPGTNDNLGGSSAFTNVSTTQAAGSLNYKVTKRISITPTLYDLAGNSSRVHENGIGDLPGVASVQANQVSDTGFSVINGSGFTAGNAILFHWTVDAEI